MEEIRRDDEALPADNPTVAEAVRECGACRACCTVHGVVELDKAPHTRCAHVDNKKGCTIYETRPDSCRVYVCGWLAGSYGDGQASRPDRLGVIVDRPQTLGGRLVVREVWRGAFDRRAVRELLVQLFRNGFDVQLIPFAGRSLPTMRAINPEVRP